MNISPCIAINIEGSHSLETVRRCAEQVIMCYFGGRSRTSDRVFEWIDTTGVATVEEASEAFVLKNTQHLLALASDKEAACHAALIVFSPERTVLTVSVDRRFADDRDLAQLTGHLARHYSNMILKPSEIVLQASPQTLTGTLVAMPTFKTSGGRDTRMAEFVERLVTVCCMVSWLLTGFDRVEIDLDADLAKTPERLPGRLVPLAFDMSGDPTLCMVLSRVRGVLLESQRCINSLAQRNHHRHRSRSRPSILGCRGPGESFRVDDLTISTLSLTLIGPWDARITIFEERPESILVLAECDWLGDQTFGDLITHIDSCIRNAPDTLASRVSLQTALQTNGDSHSGPRGT
jgi:hypothetical protein